jgi:hypothetical protein
MWRCWGVVGEAGIWQWELEDDIFGFKVPGKVSRRLAQYIHILLIQWRSLIGVLSRRLGKQRCLSTVINVVHIYFEPRKTSWKSADRNNARTHRSKIASSLMNPSSPCTRYRCK